MKQIIGIKIGMTQVYQGNLAVPVTIVDVSDSKVSLKADGGYEIAVGKRKSNNAEQGKYKALGYVPQRKIWVTGGSTDLEIGDSLDLSMFEVGVTVDVSGISKGKGFQGVVRRWGFAGGPKTHGQSDKQRSPGSIGAGTDPGRVWKGKKMGGRMGGDRVTVRNKKIVAIKDTYILVSGSIPGKNGNAVELKLVESK